MNKKTFFDCVKGKNENPNNVSKPTQYYLSYYDALKNKKGIMKWNTAAFLFSGYWLLYRKMYLEFFHYLAFSYVSITVFEFISKKIIFLGITAETSKLISSVLLLVLRLLPALFYGFMGNYLYFISVNERFEKNKTQGTNVIPPLLFLLTVIFLFQKSITS